VFGMWADVVTAGPGEVLLGMRAVFGVGAGLVLGALGTKQYVLRIKMR
jgi:hypothetical protein